MIIWCYSLSDYEESVKHFCHFLIKLPFLFWCLRGQQQKMPQATNYTFIEMFEFYKPCHPCQHERKKMIKYNYFSQVATLINSKLRFQFYFSNYFYYNFVISYHVCVCTVLTCYACGSLIIFSYSWDEFISYRDNNTCLKIVIVTLSTNL